VKTIDYLSDPALAAIYWPCVVVGLGVAVMCALLSVLVVLKRMSFVGQGISHAAFGGVGIAAVAGVGGSAISELAIVVGFCLLSAGVIAWLSARRTTTTDTAIGIVLVVAMALGAVLLSVAARRPGAQARDIESILFGTIYGVRWSDAALAWGVALAILAVLWAARRPMLFWTFDEPAAEAFGVRGGAVRLVLMVVLTLAIVASMKLAGVVLATALLVLPGAAALHLSDRLARVMALGMLAAVVGVLGGLIVSFELDWPTGPSIVGVLAALYAAARGIGSGSA
jgi:ABC-type Mn2+/Zn2+ transport system permease subunit